jgi:hypothetical protein
MKMKMIYRLKIDEKNKFDDKIRQIIEFNKPRSKCKKKRIYK